jgi:hypothetical protein
MYWVSFCNNRTLTATFRATTIKFNWLVHTEEIIIKKAHHVRLIVLIIWEIVIFQIEVLSTSGSKPVLTLSGVSMN